MSNLAVPELIIKKVSVLLNIEETDIEKVISFKHASIKEAMNIYSSIEDSGFGRFLTQQKVLKAKVAMFTKAKETYERMVEEAVDERDKRRLEKRLKSCSDELNYNKTKYEYFTNSGGIQKPISSSEGSEGTNSESSGGEVTDMSELSI